MLIGYHNSST